ncbi:hypothetical protein [Winogradskyella sp.]|uniref:hypothetical protein n=1 Tax=Winogradskyella sp. TaxID=1883156 RepID=UPI0035135113
MSCGISDKALKIVNNIEKEIKELDNSLQPEQVSCLAWHIAEKMKSVIPIYRGLLNPRWELYDNVTEILNKRHSHHKKEELRHQEL